MIEPDAKCVVNGKKVNELINAVNPLLSASRQLFDVVDDNNKPARKYLVTMDAQPSTDTASRDGLAEGGGGEPDGFGGAAGADNQRDKLKVGGNAPRGQGRGGGGVQPALRETVGKNNGTSGRPLAPSTALADTGTSGRPLAPSTALADTGTSGRPLAPSTALADTGTTAGTRGEVGGPATDEFGNVLGSGNVGMPVEPTGVTGADTTPLPGAPPRTGEPTRARGARSAVKAGPGSHRADELRRRGLKRRKQERFNRSSAKKLMDEQTAKRQAAADRLSAASKSGGKYSPYARGRG